MTVSPLELQSSIEKLQEVGGTVPYDRHGHTKYPFEV